MQYFWLMSAVVPSPTMSVVNDGSCGAAFKLWRCWLVYKNAAV